MKTLAICSKQCHNYNLLGEQ